MPNRLKIEDIITHSLGGDLQKNALNFFAYVRENKLSVTTKNYEKGDYVIKYRGKGLCTMRIGKDCITLAPYAEYTDESFESYMKELNLQDILWDNLYKCIRCGNRTNVCVKETGKSEETFKGYTKIYFGKEFDDTCKHWNARFYNPDGKAFDCIIKMMEYKRDTIVNNQWRKHCESDISKSISNQIK